MREEQIPKGMSSEAILREFLDQASGEQFDRTNLLNSSTLLVQHLRKHSADPGVLDAICKAVIANILPKLCLLSPKEQVKLAGLCQQILHHGDAAVVFQDLCLSLKKAGYAGAVNARFLVNFVSNGAEEIITRVLSNLDSEETISFLIHLPSLVMNVLGSSDTENIMFNENDYFMSLSNAICKASVISDHQSASFVRILIQRMMTLGKAEVLIASSCEFEGGRYLESLLRRAPHSSIEALVRSLLEADISFKGGIDEITLRKALSSLVGTNAIAKQACLGKIPFSQPALKRKQISLIRLINGIAQTEDAPTWKHSITTAASVWNSEEFAYCAELSLQRQVTRLLLYYMSQTIRDKMKIVSETEGLALLFSPGIQLRLSENDPRIRSHGMVIGEAASKAENDKNRLIFPRESLKEEISCDAKLSGTRSTHNEDSDSDISILAYDADCDEDIQQLGPAVYESPPHSRGELEISPDVDISSVGNRLATSCRLQKDSEECWSLGNYDKRWQYEDDWESIASWESEDEKQATQADILHFEGFEGDGKAFRVPISVSHLLNVMINANKTRGGGLSIDSETLAAALDQVSSLPDSQIVYEDTLRLAAVELCLEVCRLDIDRYPDEDKEKLHTARHIALEKMICVDFEGCGLALIKKVICGPYSDVSRRVDALGVLTKALRLRLSSPQNSSQSRTLDSRSKGGTQQMGSPSTQAVKRVSQKRQSATAMKSNSSSIAYVSKISGMTRVFQSLAQGMCEGGGASFLHVDGRDSQLWAHAIVALATVASCAGTSKEGREMRSSVIEISMRRVLKFEADAVVRRAVVLALIAVIKSMGTTEVSESLVAGVSSNDDLSISQRNESGDLAAECFEWLTHAIEFDADLGVRRFTRQALGVWARRVDELR